MSSGGQDVRAPIRILIAVVIAAVCCLATQAQGVKRLVIIKIDGLPGYYVDRFASKRDPATGKSVLPWISDVFYKNGTRVPNFYTRGTSLSGPSWGVLDTGQHTQIKGNVEYDRYTLHAYDYLNFLPYYVNFARQKREDMPAAEVLDQLRVPLLCDAFPFERRYTSQQLFQRSYDWAVLASGFVKMYPGDPRDFLDEWTIGLDYRKLTINQTVRDITGKLAKRPDIDYFDYYDSSFDHASHHNNDTPTRLAALKDLDRLIGRIWVAIEESPRFEETALILVSDHGFNSDEKVYSQGFNLVKLLASATGGGHHVITKRRLMLDYSIKGAYPFVPLIRTASDEASYLKGQSSSYPTALLDFDGNERSTIHLRNSDLNMLHILLQQLQKEKLASDAGTATIDAFFGIIDDHRNDWQKTLDDMREELDALHRLTAEQKKTLDAQPKKFTPEQLIQGADSEVRRLAAQAEIGAGAEAEYRKYTATLTALLGLQRNGFDARKIRIEGVIAPGAMGDANSVHQLQNYVTGPAPSGLVTDADKHLDLEKSFTRTNYFDLLLSKKVMNNVQPGVSSRPVDFVAVTLPVSAISPDASDQIGENVVWLYGGAERQALILSRLDEVGGQNYRYMPISGLTQDNKGKVTFQTRPLADGFPLKYFEDKDFGVPMPDRASWLSEWHTEIEWMNAAHKTVYSNAIIGLIEQLGRKPVFDLGGSGISPDEKLIRRFRERQRMLTDPDLLILANDHWNFDVRGFNPGGNHGSFFRVSTNATLMMAGGAKTGIPRSLTVDRPYDNLSFMPTVLRLMGKIDGKNRPVGELRQLGFRNFPGAVIREATGGIAESIPIRNR